MKKLALIGCGGIGEYHLGHFLQFKDIALAGFCAKGGQRQGVCRFPQDVR